MSGTYNTLWTFNGTDGSFPAAGVTNVNGTLYGTTDSGGTAGDGTLFSYTLGATTVQTLLSFSGGTNGSKPVGDLTDVNGLLYGTTQSGGASGDGTLFTFNLSTTTLTTLFSFNGSGTGQNPRGNLVEDANGLLYGTTYAGGTGGYGTLFSVNPSTGAPTPLVNFSGGNGSDPQGNLTDVGGTIYGTTAYGGTADAGSVFAYDIATGALTTLASFNGTTTSATPVGGVIDVNNILYGATDGSQTAPGILFAYNLATGSLSTLFTFSSATGYEPYAGLTSLNGMIYGTTGLGGPSGGGSLFAYDIASGTLEFGYNFSSGSPGGGTPEGALTAVGNTLYGTTSGGSSGNGTLYSYTPACYASGTHILTASGPVAVEHLAVGMRLPTASGRLARIAWLGHRTVEPARHPRPHDMNPIRVRAHAFGHAPARDLLLSPDHAVLVEGVLIPIRHLANGSSIAQEPRASITYWHVELDRHDAILAEGLACESYLETGNRNAFEGEAATRLHPDFTPHQAHAEHLWAERGCAPILTDPAAAALRRHHTSLLARARRAA